MRKNCNNDMGFGALFTIMMAITISLSFIFVTGMFIRLVEFNGATKTSIRGLQEYQVYKHSGASLTEGDAFAAYIRGTGIGVTVIPPNKLDRSMSLNELAQEISSEMSDSYDTIIVVQDGPDSDIVTFYSNKQEVRDVFLHLNIFQKEVLDAGVFLNNNKTSLLASYIDAGGTAGTTTKQHVEEQKQQTQSDTPSTESSDGEEEQIKRQTMLKTMQTQESAMKRKRAFLLFSDVSGAVLFVGALILGRKKLLAIYRKEQVEKETTRNSLQSQIRSRFALYSKDFQDAIVAFGTVGEKHANILNTHTENNLAPKIKEVRENLELLADALERNQSDFSQRVKLEVQYADQLTKMSRILGPDYYMHMVRHPQTWANVDERIQLVKDALKALNEQVLENIHQINENREFEFKVALQSFLGSDEIDAVTISNRNLTDSLRDSVNNIVSSIKCKNSNNHSCSKL
jgi:hypothetical protein